MPESSKQIFTVDGDTVSGIKWKQSNENDQKRQNKVYDDVMSDVLYDSVDPKYVVPIRTPDVTTAPTVPPRFPDHSEADIEPCGGYIGLAIDRVWIRVYGLVGGGGRRWSNAVLLIAVWIALIAYMSLVLYTWKQGGKSLDWCTGYGPAFIIFGLLLWFSLYYHILKPSFLFIFPWLTSYLPEKSNNTWKNLLWWMKLGIGLLLLVAFGWFVADDTKEDRRRLISLGGLAIFLLFGLVFSKHPKYVNWPLVTSGLTLQIILGLLIVRWKVGRIIFQCLGEKVQTFLEYGYDGARFVYGPFLTDEIHVFAFQVLSVIFFLSMVVEILFYLGWLQSVFFKMGTLLQSLIGTTIIESVNAVCTIFLSMSEAPLLYKPYIKYLTLSELHAVMTAGFSTIAGTVMAAYTSMGVSPVNLLTASVMAAPGSLFFSKLFYPETKKTRTSSHNIIVIKSSENSIIDAACKGAFSAIELVLGIIASLIACISLISFLNGLLAWLGILIGLNGLSFDFLLGKLFIPLAWIMGVIPSQCEDVARLIGLKTMVNEFVAYKEMGHLKKAGKLTSRSEAIVTFALCGFANPASVSIMLATFSSICPEQKENAVKTAFRAFVCGSCTSFISACIIGLLTPENGFN